MKLSIDADQMLYSCGFAAEGEPIPHALKLLKNKIEQIFKDCGTEDYVMYVAGEGNFRDDLTFDYKANRTSRKPDNYAECKEYLINVWGAIRCDGLEADDMVSMDTWNDWKANGADKDKCQVICCSPDKDLKNTPGWHYNPRTRDLYWITEQQADRHFYFQLLRGDNVDNIKGLPYCAPETIEKYGLRAGSAKRGCGEASAKLIMKGMSDYSDIYACYAEWGKLEGMSRDDTFDYMELQGRLLYMARELDAFDAPELWQANGQLFDDIWEGKHDG